MTSKKLNIIVLVCLILFSVIFGVAMAIKRDELRKLDDAYDKQIQDSMDKENQGILDDLNTQNKNEQNNNLNITAGSNTFGSNNIIDNKPVNFTEFVDMYNYAEKKLNAAVNIHSTAYGTGTLSGPTSMSNISIKNEKIAISFERAQNTNQKYFNYHVTGSFTSVPFNLDYQTSLYAEGAMHYLLFNQDANGWQPISESAVQSKFAWDTNKTFHIINKNSVKSSSLIFDKYSKTYTGIAELNVDVSAKNFSQTLMGAMGAKGPARYKSAKITVVFDQYGNFKSIKLQETFNIDVHSSQYNTTMYATCTTDYTETFNVSGAGTVKITRPSL